MNENELLLSSYAALAEYLQGNLGVECTTVLYQINEDETDGIAIAQFGEDDFHKKGDSLTPFLKRILQGMKKSGQSGVTHMDTLTGASAGRVKLNIFTLRSKENKIIGLFVICTMIDNFYLVEEIVSKFLGIRHGDTFVRSSSADNIMFGGAMPLSDYMQQVIRDEIAASGISVDRMTMEEKCAIVHRLDKLEVFFMRDSVRIAAEMLDISVPTVYRLLKKES